MKPGEQKIDISLQDLSGKKDDDLDISLSKPRIDIDKRDLGGEANEVNDLDIEIKSQQEIDRETHSFIIETPEFQAAKKDLVKRIDELQKRFVRGSDDVSINFSNEDLDIDQLPQDEVEKVRRLKIQDELKKLELSGLTDLYQGETYYSPIQMDSHVRQENDYSCTVATVLNAMRALGLNEGTREEDIAESIGQAGENDPIDINLTLLFLEKKNLKVDTITSVSEIVDALERGGVVLFTELGRVGHRILISGIEVKNGEIKFIVNNPQIDRAQKVPLSSIISKMNYDVEVPSTQAVFKK